MAKIRSSVGKLDPSLITPFTNTRPPMSPQSVLAVDLIPVMEIHSSIQSALQEALQKVTKHHSSPTPLYPSSESGSMPAALRWKHFQQGQHAHQWTWYGKPICDYCHKSGQVFVIVMPMLLLPVIVFHVSEWGDQWHFNKTAHHSDQQSHGPFTPYMAHPIAGQHQLSHFMTVDASRPIDSFEEQQEHASIAVSIPTRIPQPITLDSSCLTPAPLESIQPTYLSAQRDRQTYVNQPERWRCSK